MRNVEIAAQAMDDRASQREQVRLKEIKDVTLNSRYSQTVSPLMGLTALSSE